MPKKKSFEEFQDEANKKYNRKFKYLKEDFKNYFTKITITCPKHGKFKMEPKHHLRSKYGCPICAKESFIGHQGHFSEKSGKHWAEQEFLEAAHEKFGNKFSFEKMNYVNMKTPITIICSKHGDFIKTPQQFITSMHGCNKCCHEHINISLHKKSKISDKEEFVKLAKKTHGDRYDYSKTEISLTRDKVCIICSDHGEFWQMPYLHLRGEGCPECKRAGIFNCERRIGEILKQRFPSLDFVHDKSQQWLKVNNISLRYDWYCPDHKFAVEYQGAQHFKDDPWLNDYRHNLRHTQELDKKKLDLSIQNNVKIFYFTFNKEFIDFEYPLGDLYTDVDILCAAISDFIQT